MATSSTIMKAPGLHMALATTLLLSACTTTTTITSEDDFSTRSGARAATSSSRALPDSGYVVQRGDTLYAIAFRQRVDLRELIAWNRLSEPYTIYPGQRLQIGPASDRQSMGAAAPPSGPSTATEYPRVAAGRSPRSAEPPASTLPPSTATEYPRVAAGRVDARPAAPASQPPPSRGDTPVTPGLVRAESSALPPVASMPAIPIAEDGGVREAAPGESGAAAMPSMGVSTSAAPLPPPPLPQTPAEPTRDMLAVRSAPTRTVGGIGWRWPNGATLVGRFAADDESRQGVRLQGTPGTQVNASADGEVVYSGNGLVGLGELVIIKHGAEYLSAYGLNRKRLVTEGQKVKAGQPVAEMGSSAGMAGLLHFEVRRGGRPIDPLSVLPPR